MTLLRQRGFLLLGTGQFLNIIASWSLRTVMLIWVYALTKSGVAVSLVGLSEAVPLLLLAPVTGVYVDRWNRAYTMAAASAGTAVVVLPLLTVSSRSGIPLIVASAILANSFNQLFMTAAASALPVVVGPDRTGEANSLLSIVNGTVAVAGPAAAALLFATLGPHAAVLIFAVIFLLAAPVLAMVPAPRAEQDRTQDSSVGGEILAGLRYVRHSTLLT